MDTALSSACIWLADHPRITAALVIASILFVAALDMPA